MSEERREVTLFCCHEECADYLGCGYCTLGCRFANHWLHTPHNEQCFCASGAGAICRDCCRVGCGVPGSTCRFAILPEEKWGTHDVRGDHVHPCPNCYRRNPCKEFCTVEGDGERWTGGFVECCPANGATPFAAAAAREVAASLLSEVEQLRKERDELRTFTGPRCPIESCRHYLRADHAEEEEFVGSELARFLFCDECAEVCVTVSDLLTNHPEIAKEMGITQ